MTVPSVPNFTENSGGRLSTSRNDFQNHTDGYSFRHASQDINLEPALFIDGQNRNTVLEALQAIIPFAQPEVLPNATTGSKGVIQLRGDIAGTATNIQVTKIQHFSVSPLTPSIGNVLTYSTDGSTNFWKPVAPAIFSAGGDLVGTAMSQQVIGLTGTTGTVRISADTLNFDRTFTPSITQTSQAGVGTPFTITTQETTGVSTKSGNLVLQTGQYNGGTAGDILLKLGNIDPRGPRTILHAADTGSFVLSLFKTVTTTQMPADTGSSVLYVADTSTPPNTGSPVGGCIVYSEDGLLKVKQSDGGSVTVGQFANPAISGPTGQQQKTIRYFDAVTNPTNATRAVAIPVASIVYVRIKIIAKLVGSTASAYFTYESAYSRTTGSPFIVGSVTSNTTNRLGAASGWTPPSLNLSGTNLVITLSEQGAGPAVNYLTIIESLTVAA